MSDQGSHTDSDSVADAHTANAAHGTPPAMASQRYQAPYKRLYIYYLEGLAGKDGIDFGGQFIGNWEEDGYSFLFFSSPAMEDVRRFLAVRPDIKLLDQYDMAYDDWQGGRFQGLRVGRLFIRPPWAERPASAAGDDVEILLDPGVVFGAGTHATTRDCLAALEIVSTDNPGRRLLDLGTGTGVLAVAAARLGWQRVLAVDFNRLAAKTARRNVRLNDLDTHVLVVHGRAEQLVACPTDVMVANLHYDVMRSLIRSEGFRQSADWILSGLLRSQAREVEAFFARNGMVIRRRWSRDNTWFTYLGTHRKRL
jgi:ribosomal protein L11 methyltransferase